MYQKVNEKNDLTFGTDRVISVANMYFKTDVYITDPEYLRTYNVFKLGDIAFEGNRSKNYAHGRFVENTIGDGIVSHVFVVFRPMMEFDLWFWKYAINNERLMGDVLIRSTKSSTMMTDLVVADFLKDNFLVPSLNEQKKIGEFFVEIDRLITLHQRECDKLVNVKKAMLEKKFPKDGADKPEIRFAGFTDAWEQRKLEALYRKRSERNINLQFGREDILSVAKMRPYASERIDISSDDYMKTYNVIRLNDIAFEGHTSKEFEYGRFVLNDYGNGIVSHVFDVYEPIVEFDSSFIKEYIHYEPIMKQILVRSTSSARMMNALKLKEFLQESLRLPKLNEQRKIGKFFDSINDLITLHQRAPKKPQKNDFQFNPDKNLITSSTSWFSSS